MYGAQKEIPKVHRLLLFPLPDLESQVKYFCCYECYCPKEKQKHEYGEYLGILSVTIPERFIASLPTVTFSGCTMFGPHGVDQQLMVRVLHRHKQRVQHIHSLSSKTSHEVRAARPILVLVSSFVSFYCLSSLLTHSLALIVNPSWWLLPISVLVSPRSPAFSPFVLTTSDTRASRFCFACLARKTVLVRRL